MQAKRFPNPLVTALLLAATLAAPSWTRESWAGRTRWSRTCLDGDGDVLSRFERKDRRE